MSSRELAVGHWVRICPHLRDSFVFGLIAASRQDALVISVAESEGERGLLGRGVEVEGVGLAGDEIVLFASRVTDDAETTVTISRPRIESAIPLRPSAWRRCDIPASYQAPEDEGAVQEATIEDISTNGLFLACREPVRAGDHVGMRFMLPDGSSAADATVRIVCTMPARQCRDRRHRAGGAFTRLSPVTRMRIARFVADGAPQREMPKQGLAV